MRKLFLFFCCILYSQLHSQTTYVFNVELNDKNNAPTFTQSGSVLIYSGSNPTESAFFANYTIYDFNATYPNYPGYLANVFTFVTSSSTLMNNLKTQFPSKYLKTEDLTGMKIQLVNSYPNDYGNGVNYVNPVPNLGANISLKSLDYVNCPKAWDFFPGNNPKGSVTIGISDGMVNTSDIDLSPTKVTYLHQNQFNPGFYCDSDSDHGTGVAAIAAAQGNNSHGIAGVCYDCKIVNIPYQVDHRSYALTPNFPGLMEMANLGIRVINMSWIQGYIYNDPTYSNPTAFVQTQQDAIDVLFGMGVVLVAGAGNIGDHYGSHIYAYPASYNHVISVTMVNARNPNITDETDYLTDPVYGPHSHRNDDMICHVGYLGLDPSHPVFTPWSEWSTTVNSRVDICGPGYAPSYGHFLLGCLDVDGKPSIYADATSSATPFISGTVALMQSLNSCILPDEVEDVLQLTSRNLENIVLNGIAVNAAYIGRSGSGKLETGDAVEFTSEMMNPSGNALIDGQDFWRFNFSLQHINNRLTISNQTFRDGNTSNFRAKNAIDVLPNSDFRPNSNGFVDLNINTTLTVCGSSKVASSTSEQIEPLKNNKAVLYPNPNKGSFSILLNRNNVKDVAVTVFDVFGKLIYQTKTDQNEFELNIPNLPTGMYLVKLSSNSINETLKFIKD